MANHTRIVHRSSSSRYSFSRQSARSTVASSMRGRSFTWEITGPGCSIFSILGSIFASVLMAVLTGLVIFGVGYMLPFMKVGSRRQHLDTFLAFTSSYMTVLASAGVTPERILRSTAEKDPKFMLSDEIANVVGRIDLLGYDVLNALNAEVDRSPSTNYQDLLRGFAGVIRTGGDMKKFFQGITDHLFQKRALQVQSFLDSLGIIAETYVLMLIAFPLMLIVMLSIMASIGGSLGGVDVFSFMYLMAFILIPICGLIEIAVQGPNPFVPIAGLTGHFSFDRFLLLGGILALIPPAIMYFFESKRRDSIDNSIPHLIRDIADAGRSGMTLTRAIEISAERDYGPLTTEIKKIIAKISVRVP